MHLIDWILVGGSLLLVLVIGVYTQQYMRSVSDFMSAGRLARRYLLAVSKAELATGAVVFVNTFEVMGKSGFAQNWWGWFAGPIFTVIGITGFVTYRYRETRVLTLAQFFEVRYTKAFRLFSGLLGFFAGILNFGIIPAVGARFMVYILGMPPELHLFGITVATFIPLMAFFLAVNVYVTCMGGLITIMMTNCIEGIVSQIMFLVLIFGLLSMFSWSQIGTSLSAQPPGKSFLNPMDTGGMEDFNIWNVAMGTATGIFLIGTWQNRSSYASAPLNAHEARMGGIMGGVRGMGLAAAMPLLAICAYTYLHHPDFAAGSALVHAEVDKIADPHLQEQMLIPIALTHLLPAGLKGAFCAILLLGIFGGDSTHLHSWGGVFIQDVILPYRKKPLSPAQHIGLLRWAMAGVAVFGFFFGVLVPPSDYISMWFGVTQAVFTGGAGAALIGGLYWKKGTAAGAWTAMLTGSFLSVSGIVLRFFYAHDMPAVHRSHFLSLFVDKHGTDFFINGTQIGFFSSIIAVSLYVGISLLTWKEDFNLDRMLHRGQYAVIDREVGDKPVEPSGRKVGWGKLIGFDKDFTLGDKWIAGSTFGWSSLHSAIMILGTLWFLASQARPDWVRPWSIHIWSEFWHYEAILVPVLFSVVIVIWFTWGGIVDSLDLFRRLRKEKLNDLDDGRVIAHQNLDESVLPDAVSPVNEPPRK